MTNPAFSIETKSIGTLIDELVTTNIKCYMAQETIMAYADSDKRHIVADAVYEAQHLNARRSQLIRAIDRRLGEESITQTAKTYE